MPHGGQILVDALKAQGIKRVFCVPGESYLAALDGLYESGSTRLSRAKRAAPP
ncbi:thiamine pyrophosphate-binding protein [Phaeobacter sp. J2-8]|uniref:thiamine pyrophosphate-binding protein n=1 Tax=Phaeobacter sp. J2-8 TaxID=2931394 RepID=UPI0032AF280D